MLSLILVAIGAMVVKDAVGTFLVVAEAKGNEHLAGILNPLGTLASVIFYMVGTNGLVHDHGWKGYLGLIPVLIVDYIDGRYFTAVSRVIRSDEDGEDAGVRQVLLAMQHVATEWWMKASPSHNIHRLIKKMSRD